MFKKVLTLPKYLFASEAVKSVEGTTRLIQVTNPQLWPTTLLEDMPVHCLHQHRKIKH